MNGVLITRIIVAVLCAILLAAGIFGLVWFLLHKSDLTAPPATTSGPQTVTTAEQNSRAQFLNSISATTTEAQTDRAAFLKQAATQTSGSGAATTSSGSSSQPSQDDRADFLNSLKKQ